MAAVFAVFWSRCCWPSPAPRDGRAAARLAQEHSSQAGLDKLMAMFETQGAGTNGPCTLTGMPEVSGNDATGDEQRAVSGQ